MSKNEIFAGIDLGGTNIKACLLTREGEIVAERIVGCEKEGRVDHVLDRISDLINKLCSSAGCRVSCVGIGVAGLVDAEKAVLLEAPNLPGWRDVEVGCELKRRLNLPIKMDNDANVAALGEYMFGSGSGVKNMMMVTLGTGVGGGLILEGKIYRGSSGSAGEFGHMTIDPNGPICSCGRRGCIEAYIGTRGILRRTKECLSKGSSSLLSGIREEEMTPKHISEAAEKGDEVAIEILRKTGYYLGVGIGNVSNLLNLEMAVIGGGVSNAGELILGPAREKTMDVALEIPGRVIEIKSAQLGEKAGMVGAACIAMSMV